MYRFAEAIFLILISLTARGQAAAPNQQPAFHAKDYPVDKFVISKGDHPFGQLTVRVINVKNRGLNEDTANGNPTYCSAWVEVLSGERLLLRKSYPDIEPVGGKYGVFVPKRQPANYFAVVKSGDYNGRLLLVDGKGELVDIPGGLYFMTADGKYVVSEYYSDDSEPAFTVFDLANRRIVLQPLDTPELGSWYRDDSGYFVMEYGGHEQAERLDFENRKVLKITVTADQRKKATKIGYDFDLRKKEDCTSTQQ